MFCLVSRQAMANVLPVFMFMPEKVVLFTTPEERYCADNLEELFKSKGIKVHRRDNLDAYDYIKFKVEVNDELEKINDSVWLNVTGGTKLMALAAYEAFAIKNKKIIYCDTEHKRIITVFPEYQTEELKAELSIREYLLSYGYIINETKSDSLVKLFIPLFDFIQKENLLYEFDSLFKEARKQNITDKTRVTIISRNRNFYFIKNYDKYKIEYDRINRRLIELESSNFRIGDWLEYYVYYTIKKKTNSEVLTGVKVKSRENVENEFDIIALKDYVLYIYSCKSGKTDNQYDLFQLETLRTITSGTFGKGIFVTSNRHSSRFLDRANELKIKVINVLGQTDEII